MISDDFRILFFNQDSTACQCGVVVSNLISQAAWGGPRFHQITKALNDMRNMWGISVRPFCRRFYEAESQILWGRKWGYGCSSRMLEYVVSEFFLLGQWLNFKLFGITYLVGKIKFKLFFQGPLAEWVFLGEFVAAGFQEHPQDHAFASENMPCPIEEGCRW